MTPAEFQTFAQTVQSISFSIAAVVGGAWAAYRFWSLRELEAANVKIKQMKQSMTQRGTVNVTLTTRLVCEPEVGTTFLVATVECSNVGNRPELLNWKTGRVWSAKLRKIDDGFPLFGAWTHSALADNQGPILGCVLSPGAKESYEFLVPMSAPGIYVVMVTVQGSPEEAGAAITDFGPTGFTGTAVWSAMKWIDYPKQRAAEGKSDA